MDKAELRAQCRTWRDTQSLETVASASERICARLAAWPVFREAHTVAAYLAFGNEVNLAPVMQQTPSKCWAVPRTLTNPEPCLVFHKYDPARLIRHRFGMLEPDPELPVVEPRDLDLVLVPGVVFDRRGYRLGFGGGFYDRFLPQVRAILVGITYAHLIAESVPHDEFDQRVNWLVCEEIFFQASN